MMPDRRIIGAAALIMWIYGTVWSVTIALFLHILGEQLFGVEIPTVWVAILVSYVLAELILVSVRDILRGK